MNIEDKLIELENKTTRLCILMQLLRVELTLLENSKNDISEQLTDIKNFWDKTYESLEKEEG